jgi:hypothetical protein
MPSGMSAVLRKKLGKGVGDEVVVHLEQRLS